MTLVRRTLYSIHMTCHHKVLLLEESCCSRLKLLNIHSTDIGWYRTLSRSDLISFLDRWTLSIYLLLGHLVDLTRLGLVKEKHLSLAIRIRL
jgi:hypothetical protein